jgi:hypothetical protein
VKPQAQHSAERRLLLALVGCHQEALDKAGLVSLLGKVNWQNFLTLTSQDLYPYLAYRLEPYIECVAVPRVWETLFRARRLTAVHNLRLRHELGKAIEALRQSGIPALALKGVVLAYTTYPDPSLRPMSDLDLLVPTGKRERALHVLQQVGFHYPDSVLATHRDHSWRLAPEQEFAPLLRLRASKVLLEVHSELECSEPVLPMPAREFWCRSVAVDLHGLRVRTLCPEDFLFHLCLHQSRGHRFERGLLPLVDLRVLLDSRSDWNWAGIAARSVRCRCAAWMYLTLRAARDLASAPIPDSFFENLPQPSELLRLRCLVEDQILSVRSVPYIVPGLLSALLAEPSWRGRTRMLFTRMRLVAREEIEPKLTLAGLLRRARIFKGRLLITFRNKIPHYLRAWKNGQLRPEAIWRTARLMQKANRLFQLVVEQEAGWADTKDRVGQK